jgi:hypothetical protein
VSVEIPEEAVLAAMAAASDQDYDAFSVRVTSNRVAYMLEAAESRRSYRAEAREALGVPVAPEGDER